MVARGEEWEKICTLLCLKWITSKVLLYAAQGTLLSAMWQPDWEQSWRRMDTCICMVESLCYPPKTINIVNQIHSNIK